jgi:hypothetical protein
MREVAAEQAIDELAEGAAIQAELVSHQMALEWGHKLFAQLLSNWMTLETYEALAYEDNHNTEKPIRILYFQTAT